jgi:hypothetical protein
MTTACHFQLLLEQIKKKMMTMSIAVVVFLWIVVRKKNDDNGCLSLSSFATL